MTTALRTETFAVQPYTPHCRVIHDEGEHAVIGISSGNGYFSHQRVLDLAAWGLDNFRQVDLIWTDMHVAEQFEALGYGSVEAQRKTVKNLRGVRAKVTAAVGSLDPSGQRLRGRPMSGLVQIPAYRKIRDELDVMLKDDKEFRDVCDQLATRFLETKVGGLGATQQQRQACIRYVCAEVPLPRHPGHPGRPLQPEPLPPGPPAGGPAVRPRIRPARLPQPGTRRDHPRHR